MLEDGVYGSVSEISEAEKLNRSYVSRIFRLTLLAPDIVERILDGRQGSNLDLAQLSRPFPIEWHEQRERLC